MNQGRHADEIALMRIRDLRGPYEVSVFGVESDQEAVSCSANDLSLRQRRPALRVQSFVIAGAPLAGPEHPAIEGVQPHGVMGSR